MPDRYFFKSSLYSAFLLLGVLISSFGVLFLTPVGMIVRVLLGSFLLYNCLKLLPLLGFGKKEDDIVGLYFKHGNWYVIQQDGRLLPATFHGDSVITSFCLLLRARVQGRGRIIWVAREMLSAVDFKRVIMQMRFSQHQGARQ